VGERFSPVFEGVDMTTDDKLLLAAYTLIAALLMLGII
jgi:hypothetical protein